MIRTQSCKPRGLIASLVFVLATALAVSLIAIAVGAREADAGRHRTIVTKTFTKSSAIRIPDYWMAKPYPSKTDVSGFMRGSIRDVNLKLMGYIHPFPDDVAVLLVGPTGKKNALVMSDIGWGYDVSGINLTLDDEAKRSLSDHRRIDAGTYKPTQGTAGDDGGRPVPSSFPSPAPARRYRANLAVFNRTNPNGTWKLYVLDDTPGDQGKFADGWALKIRVRVLT